jgi:hypothetical protein
MKKRTKDHKGGGKSLGVRRIHNNNNSSSSRRFAL